MTFEVTPDQVIIDDKVVATITRTPVHISTTVTLVDDKDMKVKMHFHPTAFQILDNAMLLLGAR